MTDDTDQPTKQLTAEQVVRRLRLIRYSPRALRIGRKSPGVRTVARHAGLSFRTVYEVINTGRLTPVQTAALARALRAVQK